MKRMLMRYGQEAVLIHATHKVLKYKYFAEELLYLDQKHLLAMSPQELKNSEWIGSKKVT